VSPHRSRLSRTTAQRSWTQTAPWCSRATAHRVRGAAGNTALAEIPVESPHAHFGRARCAAKLKRSPASVRDKAAELGISLRTRQHGMISRAGLLLGQPRGLRLPKDTRELVLRGIATMEDVIAGRLPLCPECTARVVAATGPAARAGVCPACHLKARADSFAERFREAQDEAREATLEQQRRVDVLKQRQKRFRDRNQAAGDEETPSESAGVR
jgi:hypothetical protein